MKAVIPAAGLGTRFLPATKAQPKEMLPIVDKPSIQYVVEEAVASGIDDILIITGKGKRAIEDHFDKAHELEYILKEKKNTTVLSHINFLLDSADIFYVRQKSQKGLGDAIWCARKHIGNEPFAVLLGDDIVINDRPCTKQLIEVFEKYQNSIIAVEKIPKEHADLYGIVKGQRLEDRIIEVEDLIEKPKPASAPSNLAILGRYILTPEIFDCIKHTAPDNNGEIQLTDAIRLLRKQQKIYALEIIGKRYDIGNKLGWIKAVVELGLVREELKHELKTWLHNLNLDK